jgi:hypothetical protein
MARWSGSSLHFRCGSVKRTSQPKPSGNHGFPVFFPTFAGARAHKPMLIGGARSMSGRTVRLGALSDCQHVAAKRRPMINSSVDTSFVEAAPHPTPRSGQGQALSPQERGEGEVDDRAEAGAAKMSWTSSGLSTWLNHSARSPARRRPRSSIGGFSSASTV